MTKPVTVSQKPPILTKRYILCPGCGKHEHFVEHLFTEQTKRALSSDKPIDNYTAGTWYCDNTECGVGIDLKVTVDHELLITQPMNTRKTTLSVLLECELEDEYLFLVVSGANWSRETDKEESAEEKRDHKRYYYEEHTCPTNYLRDVAEVITLERGTTSPELDPHGLFRFINAVAVDPDTIAESRTAAEILELFGLSPEGFKKPKLLQAELTDSVKTAESLGFKLIQSAKKEED